MAGPGGAEGEVLLPRESEAPQHRHSASCRSLRSAAIVAVVAAAVVGTAVASRAGLSGTVHASGALRSSVAKDAVRLDEVAGEWAPQQNKGCTNWKDIKLWDGVQPSWKACRQRCIDQAGCVAFNYKSGSCGEGKAQECMLFGNGCQSEGSDCWDFYAPNLAGAEVVEVRALEEPPPEPVAPVPADPAPTDPAPADLVPTDPAPVVPELAPAPAPEPKVSPWSRTRSIGCQNWQDITISRHVELSPESCGNRCEVTNDCTHFGYLPHLCSGQHGMRECILFRGDCIQQPNDCWDLYRPTGQTRAPAPAEARMTLLAPEPLEDIGTLVGATGCSNWASIQITSSIEPSVAACAARCQGTPGCLHFNWKPHMCGNEPQVKKCMLFNGACEHAASECWELYENVPPKKLEGGVEAGTGCSNWAEIKMGTPSLELTMAACRKRCETTDGCLHFGYTPSNCDSESSKKCILFNGACEKAPSPCWDFYETVEPEPRQTLVAETPPEPVPAPALSAAPEPVVELAPNPVVTMPPAPVPPAPLAPTPAQPAPPAPSASNVVIRTGCSNWAEIQLSSSRQPSVAACAANCQAHPGCLHYNYMDCAGEDDYQKCMLFNGECEQIESLCWDFYPDVDGQAREALVAPAPAPSSVVKGVGCSNWEDIRLSSDHQPSADACRARCQDTIACVHFNYDTCAGDGDFKKCMLFKGDCEQVTNSCWDFYPDVDGEAREALVDLALAPIHVVKGVGCSNWADIHLSSNHQPSAEACRTKCQDTPGCVHYNYMTCSGDDDFQKCMLFNGRCEQTTNSCWDFYPDVGGEARQALLAPAPSGVVRGTGCANWADIQIQSTTMPNAEACGVACQATPGCVRFNYKPNECGEFEGSQKCMLFKGECRPAADECWDLYESEQVLTSPPTTAPTSAPSVAPTAVPTAAPTAAPTAPPTAPPTQAPTPEPTPAPTSDKPTQLKGHGCSNYLAIKISSSLAVSAEQCRVKCKSTHGCVDFNYKPKKCGQFPNVKECILFRGGCIQQKDDCWDLYVGAGSAASVAAAADVPAWRQRPGLGCSNWKHIMLATIDDSNEVACRDLCEKSEGCVSFGYSGNSQCGHSKSKQCMLFGGHCKTKFDDCWTHFDIPPARELLADEEIAWTNHSGTGCSNWKSILLSETLEHNLAECQQRCHEDSQCMGINYHPADCGKEDEGKTKACYLYKAACEKTKDSCWDLQEIGQSWLHPRKSSEATVWTHHKATGCSNWKEIRISATTVADNWKACRQRCLDEKKCKHFNFKPKSCSHEGSHSVTKECILYSGECEAQVDECWNLYTTGVALALPVPGVGDVGGLQDEPLESVVSKAAPLHCADLPAGEGSEEQRCKHGNGLGDGHVYFYNHNQGTEEAVCGPEADCSCCRRDLSKVPPAVSWTLKGAGRGCSNWQSIQSFEDVVAADAEGCGQYCAAHQGCVGFNFQKEPSDLCTRSGVYQNACMLMFGECRQEPNACSDNYEMTAGSNMQVEVNVTHVQMRSMISEWHRNPKEGCKNWKDILIKDAVTASDAMQCAALCKLQPGCVGFGYQTSSSCDAGAIHQGACVLHHSTCEFEENSCWDHYERLTESLTGNVSSDAAGAAHAAHAHLAHSSKPKKSKPPVKVHIAHVKMASDVIATTTSAPNGTTTDASNDIDDIDPISEPAPAIASSEFGSSKSTLSTSGAIGAAAENLVPTKAPPHAPSTTTRATTTTSRMNSTTTAEHASKEVDGSMELEVADPANFVHDKSMQEGLAEVVADSAGVSKEHVSLKLSLPSKTSRRLEQKKKKKKKSGHSTRGTALAEYVVNTNGLASAATIVAAMSAVKPESVGTMLTAVLERTGHKELAQQYAVKVTKVAMAEGGDEGVRVDIASIDEEACVDSHAGWTDRARNFSCSDYVKRSWCTASGGYGDAWDNNWGNFDEWSRNGVSAVEACCGCGGGESPEAQAASVEEEEEEEPETSTQDLAVDGLIGALSGMALALGFTAVCRCCKASQAAEPAEKPHDLEAYPTASVSERFVDDSDQLVNDSAQLVDDSAQSVLGSPEVSKSFIDDSAQASGSPGTLEATPSPEAHRGLERSFLASNMDPWDTCIRSPDVPDEDLDSSQLR